MFTLTAWKKLQKKRMRDSFALDVCGSMKKDLDREASMLRWFADR